MTHQYKPFDWVVRTNIRTADDHPPGTKATLIERTQVGWDVDVWLVAREDGQQEEWASNAFRKFVEPSQPELSENDRVTFDGELGIVYKLTLVHRDRGVCEFRYDDGNIIDVALNKLTKVEPEEIQRICKYCRHAITPCATGEWKHVENGLPQCTRHYATPDEVEAYRELPCRECAGQYGHKLECRLRPISVEESECAHGYITCSVCADSPKEEPQPSTTCQNCGCDIPLNFDCLIKPGDAMLIPKLCAECFASDPQQEKTLREKLNQKIQLADVAQRDSCGDCGSIRRCVYHDGYSDGLIKASDIALKLLGEQL